MKTATRKIRSPLKWHGGKSYLARRIIALMPEHRVYVEPFLGGGSILLNKPKADLEVAGDLDTGLIEFWSILANPATDWIFIALMSGLEYRDDIFLAAPAALASSQPMRRAMGFLVRNRMSRGGLGKDFAWSDRLRGGQPGDANAWDTIRADLPRIAARIADVQFNCCRADTLIRVHDGPGTLTYCDPPYLHETRTAKAAYLHEMSSDQHEGLLDTILGCQGAVLLSGYRSVLYDEALAGWDRVEFDMPNHSGQGKGKQRRIECVWSNRPLGRPHP